MSDTEKQDSSPSARPPSYSLGTGSHSASGTVSIDSSPSASYDTNDVQRDAAADDTKLPQTTRPRLYSEEDEDLRKAKAMALAIQQHPNMTPEEIHQMHFGDEEQSHIIESSQKKPKSDTFLGNIQKHKELFQTMVGGSLHGTTPTSSSTTTQSTTVDKASVISPAAVDKRTAPDSKTQTPNQVVSPPTSPSSSSKKKVNPMAVARAKANSGVAAAKAKVDSAKAKMDSAKAKAKEAMKNKIPYSADTSTRSASSQEVPRSSLEISDSADIDARSPKLTLVQEEDQQKKIRLSANVWKRRGGMGKLSYSKAWERRKVILQDNKLFYFKIVEDEDDTLGLERKDSSWFEQAALNLEKAKGAWLPAENDPSAPRGYFDLLKEGATVAASSGHSGAPSPFAISIKVKSDTYWKLCFDTHATQMEWLAALTDVVVIASVDAYNANLLLAADPNHEATMFENEYLPPPGDKDAGQQLWMIGEYRVSSEGLDEKKVILMEKDIEVSSTSASEDESDDADRWILYEQDLRALFVIVNAALVLSRASSTTPQQFWYILTFCNMSIGYYLVKGYKKRDTSSAPAVVASSGVIKGIVETEERVIEKEEVPGYKPLAGSTTVQLQKPTDSPEIDGQVFGAWCAPPGENIQVRSHGYLTSKKKVPSPGELYECTNVDIFESPHRYPDMARRVTLPKVEFEGEDPATKTWYAPDVFVVSVALPTDPPKMKSSNDGGGFTITMYFTMKQETRDILRRVTADSYDLLQEPTPDDVQKSKVNAVKLFNEYCRRAPTDPSFQSRFKLVANAQNLKEIGMPTWISKYNGTPVLIKRAGVTGFLYPHPELSCMEFDVSFHPFPYIAKQAISYMKDNYFKKVLVTFGFVIEGRSDDELPECVIGLMQLCYPDPVYAIQAADFFAGTSPSSFS